VAEVTLLGWLQIAVFVALLTALAVPLGKYIARVFSGEPVALARLLGPLERVLLRAVGAHPRRGQDWRAYATSLLVFSAVCLLALFSLLQAQRSLPLNPRHFAAAPWDVNVNTAVSFVTNTSWQFYAGETTLSTLSQMAGIALHSFLSAAVGLAAVIAVIRGIATRSGAKLGNFWSDLVRGLLYVIMPLAAISTLVLVSQGVVQTLSDPVTVHTLAGGDQVIVVGPVSSQAAIKTLGSVGGGYFNVNSAMPLENPTPLSSFVQALLILLIPAALCITFGRMVGSRRNGWALYLVMLALFTFAAGLVYAAESGPTPAMKAAVVTGANMEGKEQRFGTASTALYAAATTAGASGAVNGAMESFSGLGSAVPLGAMMTGEVIFGGVGSGLVGMLLLVLLAVFIAGLLIGRTPEYLGKQLRAAEVKLVLVGVLSFEIIVLALTAVGVATTTGRASITGAGPLGFTETLWAYTSQGATNGSAFAGYTGFIQPNAPGNAGAHGLPFATLAGSLAMLVGRYVPLVAALAIAGRLTTRRVAPPSAGTLRTDTVIFSAFLVGVILVVALLTFLPALLLGPIAPGLTDGLF
jgi:K+-transporting ATPase ATPase A chain